MTGICAVPNDEFDTYFYHLGPAALRASVCGVVDLDVFWDGLQERLPVLSVSAKRYKDVIINSADVNRSNSIYKLVLSTWRRSNNPHPSCTTTNDLPAGLLKCMRWRELVGKTRRETWRTCRQLPGLFIYFIFSFFFYCCWLALIISDVHELGCHELSYEFSEKYSPQLYLLWISVGINEYFGFYEQM